MTTHCRESAFALPLFGVSLQAIPTASYGTRREVFFLFRLFGIMFTIKNERHKSMNEAQKKSLKTFAVTANWSILHVLDEKRWEDFIKEAKADPTAIQTGDVYSVLKSCNTNCPDEIAWKYDLLCRRKKDGFLKRLKRLIKELFLIAVFLFLSFNAYSLEFSKAKELAEQGDLKAICCLGECYLNGEGVEKNETEAIKLFRSAADKGDAYAIGRLGFCYHNGKGVEKNISEAVKLFRSAAEKGDPKSMYNLGICYLYAQGVEENAIEGLKLIHTSADNGEPLAMLYLGYHYVYRRKDLNQKEEGVKYFKLAADKGNSDAMVRLGLCYRDGLGVWQSECEAVKLFRAASDKGNAEAMGLLGQCYMEGEGVHKDKGEAVKLLEAAIEKGDTKARFYLAGQYKIGLHMEKNEAEAIRLFEVAALNKDIAAMYSMMELGQCYLDGIGVKTNRKVSLKWYREAAKLCQELSMPIPEIIRNNIRKLEKQVWESKSNIIESSQCSTTIGPKFNGVEFGKIISEFGYPESFDNSNDRRFLGKAGNHKLSYWRTNYKPFKAFRLFTVGEVRATWKSKVVYEVTYEVDFDRSKTTAVDREEVRQTIDALNRKYGMYRVGADKPDDTENGFYDRIERFELSDMVVEFRYTSEGRFDRAKMKLSAWSIVLKEKAIEESQENFQKRQEGESSKVRSGGEDAL